MRMALLVAVSLAGACVSTARHEDVARPGAYEFVAHVEVDRELGAVQVDDGPDQHGTFEVQRKYASEEAARAAAIHVRAKGGAELVIHPGQCTRSCGVLSATVRETQHLDCAHGFEHEDVVVSVGKKGSELGRRQCSGPAGTFELSSE